MLVSIYQTLLCWMNIQTFFKLRILHKRGHSNCCPDLVSVILSGLTATHYQTPLKPTIWFFFSWNLLLGFFDTKTHPNMWTWDLYLLATPRKRICYTFATSKSESKIRFSGCHHDLINIMQTYTELLSILRFIIW